MRPKARELAQHGGLPDWLEKSVPAGVIFYLMDGPYRQAFPHTGCRDELPNCELMEFPAAVI
jgi:hypothetical protein